jgi:E3 ubiquitin-protein ligase makorin
MQRHQVRQEWQHCVQEEKEAVISEYKARLAAVPCRHFDQGRGTCPFGTSCFYKHEYEDGTPEDRDALQLRMATNADGEYQAVKPVTLSSFLDTDHARGLMRRRAGR